MKIKDQNEIIEKYKYMFSLQKYHITPFTNLEIIFWYIKEFKTLIFYLLDIKNISWRIKHKYLKINKPHKSKYPIAYGLDCDRGWYDLIDELLEKLSHIDTKKKIKLFQIKQKFNSLRVYLENTPKKQSSIIEYLIREYESRSYFICETCGSKLPSHELLCENYKRENYARINL